MDLCEFKATLGYTRFIQKQDQVLVVYTFNPSVWESHAFSSSTREVEAGVIWLGGERIIKGKRQELPEYVVCRFVETGSRPFCLKIWWR